MDGSSQRQAARHAGVSHGTVANWFKAYADALPDKLPGTGILVDVAEQDELFTFIGQKKRRLPHDHYGPSDTLFSQHPSRSAAQPVDRARNGESGACGTVLQRPISIV